VLTTSSVSKRRLHLTPSLLRARALKSRLDLQPGAGCLLALLSVSALGVFKCANQRRLTSLYALLLGTALKSAHPAFQVSTGCDMIQQQRPWQPRASRFCLNKSVQTKSLKPEDFCDKKSRAGFLSCHHSIVLLPMC
jgi:hypothetical protein